MDEITLLVYYYISKYIKLLGYAPTYAEIAAYGPFSSKSTEKKHVKKLLKFGLIETDHPGSPRALRIPGHND